MVYDWLVILPFLAASTVTSIAAAQVAKRMPGKRLEKAFAVFVITVALAVFGKILWS